MGNIVSCSSSEQTSNEGTRVREEGAINNVSSLVESENTEDEVDEVDEGVETKPSGSSSHEGTQRRMKEEHVASIRKNWIYLLQEIDAKYLVDVLYQEHILDLDEIDEIRFISTRKDRTRTCLTKLLIAGHDAYDGFIKALKRAGYKLAVEKLIGTEEREHLLTESAAEENLERVSNGSAADENLERVSNGSAAEENLERVSNGSADEEEISCDTLSAAKPTLVARDMTVNVTHVQGCHNVTLNTPEDCGTSEGGILSNLKATSLHRLDELDQNLNAETRAHTKAGELLSDFGIVVLTGSPGSGKTTLGLSVMSQVRDQEKRQPLILTDSSDFKYIPTCTPEDIGKVKPEDKYIVLVDDIFGKSNLVTHFKQEWEKHFENMWSLVACGLIKLIITCRTDIFVECQFSLKEYTIFKKNHLVDLHSSEYCLTYEEKTNIFEKHLKQKNINLNSKKYTDVGHSFKELGFPQCCMFFVNSKEALKQGPKFFKKPIHFLKTQFDKLKSDGSKNSKYEYLVLLLVMFKQGSLKVDCLNEFDGTNKATSDLIKQLKDVCRIHTDSSLYGQIKKTAKCIHGLYLSYDDVKKEYSFIHQSVFDSLFIQFSSEFPKESIKICPVPMLLEYVVTPDVLKKGDITVTVNEDSFSVLAERFTELLKSESAISILKHSSFQDEKFMKFLIGEYWHSEIPCGILFCTFYNIEMCDIYIVDTKQMFTHYWSETEDVSINSNSVDKYFSSDDVSFQCSSPVSVAVLNNLKMLSIFFASSLVKLESNETERQKKELLEISCLMGNTEVVDILLNAGTSPNITSFTAASVSVTDDLNIFQKVFDKKEMNVNDLGSLLCLSLQRGNVEISRFLIDKISGMEHNKSILNIAVKHLLLLLCNKIPRHYYDSQSLKRFKAEESVELFKQLSRCDVQVQLEVAIVLSACHDTMDILKEIIASHPECLDNMDTEQRYGTLKSATQGSCYDTVEFLLDYWCSIKHPEALHLAIKCCLHCKSISHTLSDEDREKTHIEKAFTYSFEKVETLVKRGADLNVQDQSGKIPLHYAATAQCYSEECLAYLVKRGADVNLPDHEGKTSLHLAAESGSLLPLKTLVEGGAKLNVQDNIGCLALHYAAEGNSEECVSYLLDIGLDINLPDNKGNTSLHLAAKRGAFASVKALLERSADVKVIDKSGNTPLHCILAENAAAEENDSNKETGDVSSFVQCVAYLVDKGSDVDLPDYEGKTPLHLAAQRSKHSLSLVKDLVEIGANVNVLDNSEKSPLHCAAEGGSEECIAYLIDKGSDVDLAGYEGKTPLHLAAHRDRLSLGLVKRLVESGANVNVLDNSGKSPLHCAAEGGSEECIAYLVDKGSDVDLRGYGGMTPLHLAAQRGESSLGFVKILVENGANLNVLDNTNKTALDLVKYQTEKHPM